MSWLAAAPALHVTGWQYPAGVLVASVFAHGRLSPDADRYPLMRRFIPGGHRGITHWWLLPVLGFIAARMYVPLEWQWAPLAVVAGWASHIVADAVFGRVPIYPRRGRWARWGVGLRTGGTLEKWAAVPALFAAAAWLVVG